MAFNPRDSPGFLVSRVSHQLRARITSALREAGHTLSAEELAVLMVLADRGDDWIRVADLAHLLMRDPTTVKRQLNALYESKLVRQSADPSDGRVVLLQATETGRRMIQKTTPLTDTVRRQVLEGVSKSDLQTTLRTLQKFLSNLEQDA